MATVSKGRQFVSGEIITPAKLNDVVDLATVTDIQTADIADGQITTVKILDANVTDAKLATGIDASKLTTGTLPIARIADGAVVNDKLSLAANAGEIKKALNADNAPPIFACRAWVNFEGRTTNGICTLVGSGNVASVERTNSGRYSLTFTTAMPDANYAIIGGGHWDVVTDGAQLTITVVYPVSNTGFVFTISDATGNTYVNPPNNSIAIFR